MGKAKVSLEEVRKRVHVAHNGNVSIPDQEYKGTQVKILAVDKDFGEFFCTPVALYITKTGHPKRASYNASERYKTPESEFIKLLDPHVTLVPGTYINMSEKCKLIDSEYGEFLIKAESYKYSTYKRHSEFNKKAAIQKAATPLQDVIQKIKEIHGDQLKIKNETYISCSGKAIFVDCEHGEFITTPEKVISRKQGHPARSKQKQIKTNMDRYGVPHNMQHPELALKCVSSSNNTYLINHWKTGEELVCQFSYEKAVVEYLNYHKINFGWQPCIFHIPDSKKTYRPDMFLYKENKWIEIKGRFIGDAQEKWDWFHGKYPNSELWDEKKLKAIGIL